MKKAIYQTKNQLLILAGCCLLMIFIIKPWELYFLNDDFIHIPLDIHYLFERGGFMRPVPNIFLELDKWLYGKNASGFFTTTLLLHFICSFCAFFLLKKITSFYFSNNGLVLLPLFTAVLFTFYPFHTEALMWTISRVATIATIFTLLSLNFYITASKSKADLFISWLFYVIALFTYESMWNALLIFLIISIINYRGNKLKQELITWLFFFVTFLAYLFVRVKVLSSLTGDGYDSFQENSTNIPFLIGNWVKLIARVFTPPFLSTTTFIAICLVSVSIYSALIFKVFRANKKVRKMMIVAVLAMITGVATAAILGIDTHRGEADRYLYYSSVFYCLIIALIIIVLLKRNIYQILIVSGLSFVFIFLLSRYQKSYSYASSVTRTTTLFIRNYPSNNTAYFIDVPKAVNGSLIFRTGLPEAIEWISPECKYHDIRVLSQVDQSVSEQQFITGEISWEEFSKAKNLSSKATVRDSSGREVQLQPNDIVYWFNGSGLLKVISPGK